MSLLRVAISPFSTNYCRSFWKSTSAKNVRTLQTCTTQISHKMSLRKLSMSNIKMRREQPRGGKSALGESPVSWTTVLFTLTAGSAAVLTMKHFKKKKEDKIDMENIKSLGRPALGGDFELIDQDGKPCGNKNFLGQWVLIYFGFTHCPDICPEELEKMGNIVDTIKRTKSVPNLQPVFISIDPERDSTEAVKKYLSDFHPDLIGLTGNRDQIETASRAFRVYYSEGPRDTDDDYIVDHTVIMYLLDPDGEFCEYYGQNKSAGEISSNIISIMAKYVIGG